MRGVVMMVAAVLAAIGAGAGLEARLSASPKVNVSVQVSTLDVRQGIGAVRVAVRDETSGLVRLGPVLATFTWDSGSHPETVRAAGAIWLFELETANGPMVWRISASTGDVEQTSRAPRLVRPFLAADASGLYLGGDGSFGGLGNGALVFFVPIGASSARTVLTTPRREAELAIVASFTFGPGGAHARVCVRPNWETACRTDALAGSTPSTPRRTVDGDGITQEVIAPR